MSRAGKLERFYYSRNNRIPCGRRAFKEQIPIRRYCRLRMGIFVETGEYAGPMLSFGKWNKERRKEIFTVERCVVEKEAGNWYT